jgi:hypothetical protein
MKIRQQLSALAFLCVASTANASSSDHWESFSDAGAFGLIGIAMALPAYKEDWDGFKQAGYSLATAAGIGQLGKWTIDEERPDKSDNNSFPSNHAATAFAAATTLNLRYGWEVGLPAYGMATLVGVGRVEGDKHYWKDVIAGAVIGSFAGWLFTDALDENVQIVPWAGRNEAGITVAFNW